MDGYDFSGIDPETGERWSPRKIVQILGLRAINDEGEILQVCEKVIGLYPKQAEEYRKGKKNVIGRFIKAVMDETKNGANPLITNRVLEEILMRSV